MHIDFGDGSGWGSADWISLIGPLTAILAILVSLVVSKRTLDASRYNSDQATWQKANETELTAIEAELAGFYGPLIQKGEVSRLLSRDLRARQTDKAKFLLLVKPGRQPSGWRACPGRRKRRWWMSSSPTPMISAPSWPTGRRVAPRSFPIWRARTPTTASWP